VRPLAARRAEALKDLFAQALTPTGIATHDTATGQHAHDGPVDGPVVPSPHEPADGPANEPTAARSAGCATVPLRGRALLTITMDHRWLTQRIGHGVLDSDTPISPDAARRWACDAAIVPMVLGARSEPLDIGRMTRIVPEGLRRALITRDGGCSFPGCTRRPRRCHAHHLKHWTDGGPTSLENLTLLCRFHHTLIHADQWHVAMIRGRPWFTPPAWLDPDRIPRLGGRHPVPTAA
jgi:hypothetical protein